MTRLPFATEDHSLNRPVGQLLEPNDTVLLVIDVQDRLLPHIRGGDRIVANIIRLVRFARIVGIPTLWAEQEKLGPTAEPLRQVLEGEEPIRKLEFGALGCSRFSQTLRSLGRRSLLLTGIEAHICVAQTALQALSAHTVHVVADAVGSRDPDNRQIALDRLRQAGAVVTCVEMAMYELLRKAGTDEFRQVLPLVK